jgi:hypothetical protein
MANIKEVVELLRLGSTLDQHAADIIERKCARVEELEVALRDCQLSFQNLVEFKYLSHDMADDTIDMIEQALAGEGE